MTCPMVSVVIPLYNRRDHIARAVDSVLAQTHREFELVVIDDGSTDGGADVARSYADPRLRVVVQANGGECAARNRGISEARGEWIAFLDSDDEWLPGFLGAVTALAASHPALAAVFTNARTISPDAPWLKIPFREPRVLEDYFALCIQNAGRGITSSSVLVRKRTIERAGGFPWGIHRSGDLDAWLRLAMEGPIGCVPDVLAVYHNETAGSATLFPEPFFPQPVKTIRRLRAQGLTNEAASEKFLRLENIYLLTYARDLIVYGDPVAAARVLLRECSWRHCSKERLARVGARVLLARLGARA